MNVLTNGNLSRHNFFLILCLSWIPLLASAEEDLDESLDYTFEELIELYPHSFSVGIGHVGPWQFRKIGYERMFKKNLQLTFSLGAGSFSTNGELLGRATTMRQEARSLLVSIRHFPSVTLPFFYGGIVGPNILKGRLEPKASQGNSDDFVATYAADFERREIVIGFNSGFQWVFQNQMFCEFAVLQASRSILLAENDSNDEKATRDSIANALSTTLIWSGINITVGYRF